jgi:hypothetical protein
MKHPNAITAYIVQNGNIYEEGWSSYWDPVRLWWTNSDPNMRTSLINNLQPPHIKGFVCTSPFHYSRFINGTHQWQAGTKDGQVVSPETYTLDSALLAIPGRFDALMDLFFDHRTNVALYPEFQKFVRDSKVRILHVRSWFFDFHCIVSDRLGCH